MNKVKKYFPKPLRGEFIGDGQWELTAPFEYHSKIGGIIKIPIGFCTDGASIPKIFHSIIGSPWSNKYPEASLPHDYLYFTKQFTRKKSDQIFLEAMERRGVPRWRRYTMYWAVRISGWICWNKRKPFLPIKPILVLLILLCLSGCSTVRIFRDEEGKVTRINSSGIQETKIKTKEEEITHETKIQFWPKDLLNVIIGTKSN